jgi:Zn-dependent peptidase ImmA (M78 family)/transcriptional regulator with XRE-family HTH domain
MIDLARGYVGLFDPFRLKLAREFRGLRKSELAKRIDLTPAALTQYENGTSKPSAAALVKLALALGQSIEFFAADSRRSATPDHGRAFFRSLRSARQLERDRAEARAFLVIEVVDELRRHVRLPALNIPDTLHVFESADQEIVEHQAEQLRLFWNMDPGPVPNMVRLLEANGIVVARCSIDCREVDAFSRWFGAWPLVVLDSDKRALDRLRFDAAHELGHIVMHADPEPGNGVLEEQAHWFAAAFLIPRATIRHQLPSRFVLNEFRTLKKIWGVSVAALLRRARDLRRMTDATYRRAMMMLSKMNQRKNESAFPLEGVEPAILLAKAVEVLEKAGYTIEDLARDTRLQEPLVHETVFDDEDVRPRVELSLT